MSAKLIAGIDVGKRTCHIAIAIAGQTVTSHTATREQAARTLLEQLDALVPEPAEPAEPPLVALELTGSLAIPIIRALEESGRPLDLRIANHTDSAALRQLLRSRRKTDRLDARLICRLAALTTNPETAALAGHHLTAWSEMRQAIYARISVRHLQALVRHRARLTQQLQYAEMDHQAESYRRLIAHVSQEIKAAEATMLASSGRPEELLTTIPGITPRRAAILAAAIGDPKRFPTADNLVSYIGLTPPHRPQSGSIVGTPIRRRSLQLLATELHMYTLSVAARPERYDRIGATYQRLRARHDGRIAGWGVRRQLIRICWGVLSSDTAYRAIPPDLDAATAGGEVTAGRG